MNEVKESLRSIEQKYKLFQQQQFTFIAALEHCREAAHDKIRPITSIEQVTPPGRQAGRAGSRGPARPTDARAASGPVPCFKDKKQNRPREGKHVSARIRIRILTGGKNRPFVPSAHVGVNDKVFKNMGSRLSRPGLTSQLFPKPPLPWAGDSPL